MLPTLLCLEEQEQVVGEEAAASSLARPGPWCARKEPPTTWGAAGAPCRTLLLWRHWGSSEGLLGRAGTKQDPAELGAAAPTVEVPAGLQVTPVGWGCPPAMQGHAELPCTVLLMPGVQAGLCISC